MQRVRHVELRLGREQGRDESFVMLREEDCVESDSAGAGRQGNEKNYAKVSVFRALIP